MHTVTLLSKSTVRKRGRGIHDFDLKLRIVLEKRLKIKYHMSSRKLAIALI